MDLNIETLCIEGLTIDVIRKRVKNLRLVIYPPDARIKITAPVRLNSLAMVSFITERLDWIKNHREKILASPQRTAINFINGEAHDLFGHSYTLQVTEHQNTRATVNIHEKTILMNIPHNSTKLEREGYLNQWYREQLKLVLPDMFQKWSNILGVNINHWAIKKMKTRWGSCNPRKSRISISLELAKHSHECVEYVACHELAHLLEASHNQRFKNILSSVMPDWKLAQLKLKNKI